MIEEYRFGEILVKGRRYRRDVTVDAEGRVRGWWRRTGHRLSFVDLEELLKSKPEILVVGTGYYGMMKVPEEVVEELTRINVEVVIRETREACRTFNELVGSRRAAAALHLTC